MTRKETLLTIFCILPMLVFAQPEESKRYTLEISNPWGQPKENEPVVLKLADLKPGFAVQSAVVRKGNEEIPSQLDDLDADRLIDELAFVISLPANGKEQVEIELSAKKSDKSYPAQVYAEMLISDKNKGNHQPVQSITIPGSSDIYSLLHHHGPAFESNLVAYRIYFDAKQTVDIYGKFHKGLEIKESQFYPTDEQLTRGFGDDVLRVSGSCGLGTLKGWDGNKATHITPVATRTERIVAYGPLRTIVEVAVTGWNYQGSLLNMTHRYILYAGHRDVTVETFFDRPLKEETFSTGVQDIQGSVSYSDHQGLIGCWGTDWPVNDTVKYAKETVGLATCIPQKYIKKEVKDKANYLYTLGASGEQTIRYYITFTSLKETFGYRTPEAWFAHIREWKEGLNHPAGIRFIN